MDSNAISSRGRSPSRTSTPISRAPSLELPLRTSHSDTPLYSIASRSLSPEDLPEGLELGEYLKEALLRMEKGDRQKKITELRKLSDYELAREDNIFRNRKLMQDMGLGDNIFSDSTLSKSLERNTSAAGSSQAHRSGRHSKPTDDDDFMDDGCSLSDDGVSNNRLAGASEVRRSGRLLKPINDVADGVGSGEGFTSPADESGGMLGSVEESIVGASMEPSSKDNRANEGINPSTEFPTADLSEAVKSGPPSLSMSSPLSSLFAAFFPGYNAATDVAAIEEAWVTPERNVVAVIDKAVLCARGSGLDLFTHVNREDWPDWLLKAFNYLTGCDLGCCWGVAVVLWIELERAYGFSTLSPVSRNEIVYVAMLY